MTTTTLRSRVRAERTVTYAREQSVVLFLAFTLSAVHTIDGSISGVGDPTFSVTTPLAWAFYALGFAAAGLARRRERWLQWAVLAFLTVLMIIAIFVYPTMFGPRQQTVFGWFENDVYVGLLVLAMYLGVQNLRGVTITTERD